MMTMRRLLLLLLVTAPLFAQTETVHRDDFQSYGTPANPPGWVDTSVGNPKPQASGLYKTWPDPVAANNIVYGTKQSSGKPEGNNPRIGTFSTLTTKTFAASGRFEYRGRLIRTRDDARIGLTFLSSYPQQDKYYLIGLWSHAADGRLTMQLFGFGAGALQGRVDSDVAIDPNRWYRFAIQVDDTANATTIRARFWPDGAQEPGTFTIDATDAAATRLTAGRIGMWAADHGAAYVDDLFARNPVDTAAPSITFVDADTQRVLDPAQLALFKAPARIEIRVSDALSIATYTAKLDGADYTSTSPINADGTHRLTLHAVDSAGNAADAAFDLLVDQLPPVVTLLIDGAPFAAGAIFDKDVTLSANIQDISATTTAATLDGAAIALPHPSAEEGAHAVSVAVTDRVGWQTVRASSFLVDKTAPEITILANGHVLGGGESFRSDVTLTWSASDLTLDRMEATLNGAPIASGAVVSAERAHDLIVKAYDKAGHTTTEQRAFVLDKTAPEVRVLANGETFIAESTFNAPVTFTAEVHDSTPTTTAMTIDGQAYTAGTAYGVEGSHVLKVVGTDASGLVTTFGPASFTVDRTNPTVALTESGQPFHDGMKFNRDVHAIVTATDNLTANPVRELELNGRSYPLDTAITDERTDHVISAMATDAGGNTAVAGPFHFVLDKTKPVVTLTDAESGRPFAADALFARAVRVQVTVDDLTSTTIAVTRNGQPFDVTTPITADGTYTISAVATDAVGWQSDAATATFTIDTTPPHLTFTSHAEGAVVTTQSVIVSGGSDDAVSVVIGGASVTLDQSAKTFVSDAIALAEGTNTIAVTGTDKAGNVGTAELHLELDTRAPSLAILIPAANACIAAPSIAVHGTARDAVTIRVRANDGAPVDAVITNSEWTATVPLPAEGEVVLSAEATDRVGYQSVATLPLRVDRTKPVILATESGAAFAGTLFNRPLAPLVRVADADPSTQLMVTLNGAPLAAGRVLRDDGTYVLRATATDCAGNAADPFELTFTIDRTPPRIVTITPANGASVGNKPPITGTLSEPATLVDEETSTAATVDGINFSLSTALVEGLNERVFVITDRAGNTARETYALRVKTTAPLVEIVENGTPIPPGALFNRIVKPLLRVNDSTATVTATLNGAPFVSGSDVTADASYTLTATATDSFGHASAPATATFTIDRTPPHVEITSPADASVVTAERIDVRGTVDADAVSVSVNGVAATLSGTTYTASLLAEAGTNLLTATALDRAGNAGHDRVEVRRAGGPLAIVLTSPPDNMLTNRPTTVVAGQVLTTPPSDTVQVNGVDVPVGAGGMFRKLDFPLNEGDNPITATVANERGETTSVSVVVTADFTPPTLHLTANALDLGDGARFAAAPQLAVDATDNVAQGLVIEVTLDGAPVSGAIPQVANGGHAITAIARDAAGNETRIDRTFFVGDSFAVSGCGLSEIDPAGGAFVFGDTVRINGRSGGALSVLINGNAAMVADGSFCGEAAIAPGRNEIVIRCADASGNPTSEAPVTLIVNRDVEPSIAITSPVSGATLTSSTVTVTGTAGAGVVSGDVNGLPMTLANGTFTVANVTLSSGLNTIIARAKSGSGRTTVATARVTLLNAAPQIAITSPIDGTETGATSVDVTGTYVNVDPSTIAVNGAAATTTPQTDTSGTFRANASLAAGVTTIMAGGRNHAGAESRSSVDVQHLASAPSITITSPIDNAYVDATSVAVAGTFDAPPGSLVSVNGTQASLSGTTFTKSVPIGTSGATPLIARITTPAGDDALDSVRVLRMSSALALRESFPANDAVGVDRGVAIILLFNNVLDGATVANAIRITDAGNANVNGQLFVDRDAVTFAPNDALKASETYTITIATSLRDASGATLAAQQLLHFTTAGTAPAAPPLIDDLPTTGCFTTITMTGRATPGARVRLDADGIALTTTASNSGAFKFTFSFSGRTGFHIARVRELGSDGSFSAERAICFRNNCELPRVIGAALDRAARKLSIDFSRAMDPSTLVVGSTIVFDPALAGSVAFSGQTATITFDAALPERTITLTVKKSVKDVAGASMAADYTQSFTFETTATERGKGYVTGAVYDATTGRPLAGASIAIDTATLATNDRGRYSRALAEGAYTIEARADGFTTVWRQIVVPAGAGVMPIDIRLTRRGAEDALTSGGDTTVTKRVDLTLAAPVPHVRLTAVGAQSLAGLLPLGWSPLASAEIVADAPLPGAKLTFVTGTTTRTLTFAQYDHARDEWRVLASAVAIDADRATLDVAEAGAYALVYPDDAPHLAHPPAPRNGDALQGAANRCVDDPSKCALTSRSFTLDPHSILPSGRAVATLVTEGATQVYPSGTAVQATIDEQLNLADGRVLVDPPFATDLLLYRTLAGDAALADFHLAPTPQASAVTLRDGVEHVRFVEYPGRIDRGTLIGAEGGRVPGDGSVTIDIPTGATNEPLHASAASIPDNDLAAFGSIAGFRIAGGFTLSLTHATTPPPPEDGQADTEPSLLIPARAAFHVDAAAGKQVIVAEVLPQTPYGLLFRLVAIGESENGALFTTRAIDSTQLPLDGIVRDGRYVVLVANAPIAYAFGIVRNGAAISDARVTSGLGVHGLTSRAGLFVLPVPSKPAAPFTLTARTLATGDGAPKSATTAPEVGAFVDFGDLPLVAQPPVLRSVTPDGGEIAVTAAFVVRAEFDSAIDPASVANGIRVTNLTTNTEVAGTVVAAGNSVTFNASESLRAASAYAITIAPTIRGTNGAPFAQTVVKNFRTPALPAGSTTIHPERIRITFPDANGKSIIRGEAGALLNGAQAVAVRRDRDFVVRYQATVAADGSFSFSAGDGHANDRIATTDLIDLQVIDAVSRGVIAVIPLTPFASDDLRSFIAPVGRDTTFVSADGIRVTVPSGAFDVPTLIHVAPATAAAFAGVPKFGDELRFASAVELQFEGEAQKKIELDVPVPAGTDTSRNWVVGWLGESIRGPRVMVVDLAYIDDGRFHTGVASSSGGGARSIATNAGVTGPELRNYLMGVGRSGIFALVSIDSTAGPVGFGIIGGLTAGVDLFFSTLESLYASHFYLTEGRGKIAVPVVMGKQFQIVGVDAATGLESFTKAYDPIAIGDPGTTVTLPPLTVDRQGPYPILGSPFRVELLDLNVKDVAIRSIRDFSVTLSAGTITATTTLPSDVNVTMLNASNGQVRQRSAGLSVPGVLGDRIVLLVGEKNVDPYSTFSIVFNEPLCCLSTSVGDDPLPFFKITLDGQPLAINARLDANRRVIFETEASLQRGGKYRLEISNALADNSGLRIGQVLDESGNPSPPMSEPLYLDFQVREPAGKVASFDLSAGVIRDQALNGNVLLVSAMDGGILAYDVSNPAGLTPTTAPIGRHPAGITSYWGLASDHHGRIYSTGMTALMGVVRSFRLEDFTSGNSNVAQRAASTISFVPGAAASLDIPSRIIASDRPEAIPRTIRILVQDDEVAFASRQAFKDAGATVTNTIGDLEELRFTSAFNGALPYATQRVTVENLTLDMRWSADATVGQPAVIAGIVARASDRLRILYNRMTYGVVSLLGYGIAILDLNAMESNDAAVKPPDYDDIRELVRLTSGKVQADCGGGLPENAIPDLEFIPDAAIRAVPGSSDIQIFGLDPHRGVLDLLVRPPSTEALAQLPPDRAICPSEYAERMSGTGLVFHMTEGTYDHPRLKKLGDLFEARTGRRPFGRFNAAAPYTWTLEAQDNAVVTPATTPGTLALGQRGSVANERVQREYVLIPANEYGLLVVEVGGDAPAGGGIAGAPPLTTDHLVDVIWIPHGAFAARTIPRTHLATVTDGEGHVLLVDLSRLDERWNASGAIPSSELFPTVRRILETNVDTPDPRIVWRSSEPLASGTLAPVVDADTGFVFAGKLLEKTTNVVAAIDPRIQIKADIGAANGLSEIGGIVPLGITPPSTVKLTGANASLGAFRFEVALPGAIDEALPTGTFNLDVDSERVFGARTADTPTGWPRAHLSLAMQRTVPSSLTNLRFQRGFNKWISPWVVAIADPRARESYTWPAGADRAAAGCFACERPQNLKGKKEIDKVFELYSSGRLLKAHPNVNFGSTPYAYLANQDRLTARFATVMADTVRAPQVLVAAQNPAVAGGMLEETTYLHSGEVETASVDLDAGGRAGWNVMLDRTYRSRTIGGTAMGEGWDSSIYRRLRALPSGDVEYRDGAGEVWRYKVNNSGGYDAPKGLFLGLTRNDRGWMLSDQKGRLTAFDLLGRIALETDEFAPDPYAVDKGNIIRYLYGADGLVHTIVDPVGRETQLTYDGDRLQKVVDKRNRTVAYQHDPSGRLTKVTLPSVTNSDGATPAVTYGYESGGGSFNDALEIAPNVNAISDLKGAARIAFVYGSGGDRDKVTRQNWTTGESATFDYASHEVRDVLGQTRRYQLTTAPNDYAGDRVHVSQLEELNVDTSTFAFGALPAAVSATAPPRAPQTRTFTFAYDAQGLLLTSTLAGVRQTTNTYAKANGAPGYVLQTSETQGSGSAAITRFFEFTRGFLKAATAKQGTSTSALQFPVVHAGATTGTASNDVNETINVDAFGRPTTSESNGGTDSSGSGAKASLSYNDSAPWFAKGELTKVDRGGVLSTIDYPSANRIETSDPERNVKTSTDLDEWLRPKSVVTTGSGLELKNELAYDANGRTKTSKRWQDSRWVTQSFAYDAMGRMTYSKSDGIAVGDDANTSVETKVEYDLANRKVTRTLPGGAQVIEQLDGLGRVSTRTTVTGSSDIVEQFAYDLAGNTVYASDTKVASATAYDVHGRAIGTLHPDGTRTESQFDAMGNPTLVQTRDSGGALISETRPSFTNAGRLQSIDTKVDETQTRQSTLQWDGGGRTTVTAVADRTSRERFDDAGRLQSWSTPLTSYTADEHVGMLVKSGRIQESGASPVTTSQEYDTAANVTRQTVGTLTWQQKFDEDGNVTSALEPGRVDAATHQYDYDARGNLTTETKPGDAVFRHKYDAAGAPSEYRDPLDPPTTTTTDRIGRPLVRTYPDGTTEIFTWQGARVEAYRDRQGRNFVYQYNDKGQVTEVRDATVLLEELEYDPAGRLAKWRTRDAELAYENFDLEGRPRRTRQKRYANHSGFGAKTVLDEFAQEHQWNVHGERTSWTMPLPAGFNTNGWTARVDETHDAEGNLATMTRTLVGASSATPLMSATYRAAGRPVTRTITTDTASMNRAYHYDTTTGQLDDLEVSANGIVVAGSHIEYQGEQVRKATLHGVSGEKRANEYAYDLRGRLLTSKFAREEEASGAIEHLNAADFRTQLERSELPSLAFEEQVGHKIAKVTRGDETHTFSYGVGAERVSDGRFTYEFDARGRLIKATEQIAVRPRRFQYDYSATGRLVGRRAEYLDGDWKLEDRAAILDTDGLPAETTFVWDPISDQLISIYAANGTLLRQIIHGGAAYDDPIEVRTTDGALYPIFDEAGAGTLQAMLNNEGEVVQRTVLEGAYGEDEFELAGPAVDRIAVTATKTAGGAIDKVEITLRTTESLAPATVATGARLAVVDANGTVIRSATATPSLIENDDATLRWTLTGPEWTTLTTGPGSLSVAVTNTLRAAAWPTTTQILPAGPALYTSPSLPVESRDPLASIATWLATIPPATTRTTPLYTAPALSALGGRAAGRAAVSAFQALPFREGGTGLVYVRSRWYDPRTGTFLTPDPLGYKDSSNLYAFAGGDPVNGRDPLGLAKKKGGVATRVVMSILDAVFTQPAKAIGPAIESAAEFVSDYILMQTGDKKAQARFTKKVTAASNVPGNLAIEGSKHLREVSRAGLQPGQTVDDLARLPREEVEDILIDSSGKTAVVATIFEGFGAGSNGVRIAAVSTPTPVRVWQDYLPAARQRLAATRAGLGISDELSGGLVAIAQPNVPVLLVKRSQLPAIAANIERGLAEEGRILTRLEGRSAIRQQRRAALRGQLAPSSGLSLDEFPFASTSEGGAGSYVAVVPVQEQNIQGGMLSSFYQRHNLKQGDRFIVRVLEDE